MPSDLDVVLLDLVDERRGFWKFPDGTTMTNSIEVESCGAARAARRSGARLVEFGTDEHFDQWKSGFITLIEGLKDAELWEKTILLDIEWAGAIDGAQHPQNDGFAIARPAVAAPSARFTRGEQGTVTRSWIGRSLAEPAQHQTDGGRESMPTEHFQPIVTTSGIVKRHDRWQRRQW